MTYTLEETSKIAPNNAPVLLEPTPLHQVLCIDAPQAELEKITGNLINLIRSARKTYKSRLTKMAEIWTIPWWSKIVIALIIIVPLVAVAVLFQIYTLLAIGILIAILYTGFSLLLQEHHTKEEQSGQEIEKNVIALGNLLINIINDLHRIRTDLSQQVKLISKEISFLNSENGKLNNDITSLKEQITHTNLLNQDLNKNCLAIKASEQALSDLLIQEKKMTADSEINREKIQNEYTQALNHLQKKITELTHINNELSKELQTVRNNCEILLNTNRELLQLNEETEHSNAEHYEQLSKVLEDKEKRINQVVDKFAITADGMKDASSAFKQTLEESTNLLNYGSNLRKSSLFVIDKETAGIKKEEENGYSSR